MNWRRIATYAFVLFASQFAIGVVDGFFAPKGWGAGVVGYIVTFVVSGSIFAHLAFNHHDRPFEHALAALVLDQTAGVTLSLALATWLGSLSPGSIMVGWLVLVCSLLVGTAVGSHFRRTAGKPVGA